MPARRLYDGHDILHLGNNDWATYCWCMCAACWSGARIGGGEVGSVRYFGHCICGLCPCKNERAQLRYEQEMELAELRARSRVVRR